MTIDDVRRRFEQHHEFTEPMLRWINENADKLWIGLADELLREPSGGGYARINARLQASGQFTDLVFPLATAAWCDGQPLCNLVVFDAERGGNRVFHILLD